MMIMMITRFEPDMASNGLRWAAIISKPVSL